MPRLSALLDALRGAAADAQLTATTIMEKRIPFNEKRRFATEKIIL